ncbi:hypothetical protein [Massilia genomosp. 1]|uniref:HEAT repeat domain-containing protein n=1 Tax=Massilia genomosp. 1 TaxID=2609280 RepID=A0ABX0MS25_9BURK|nr:hypothetical protein [Massilia genomosp. 1]NHZ65550.1 hypothetical protein [Massilia genomosp. 1]
MKARVLKFLESPIQSSKLSREAFAIALRHGRGSVVMHLREHGMDGVEDLVLAACLTEQCLDSQCEGSRAPWTYSLFKGTPAYPRFVDAIVAAIPHSLRDTDGDHLRALAGLMARDGDAQAADALRSFVWAQDFSGMHIIGAAELTAIDGMPAVVEMARRLGTVIQQDPEASVDLLGNLIDDSLPIETVVAELKRVAAGNAAVAAYVANKDEGDAIYARWDYSYAARQAGAWKRHQRFMHRNPVEVILAAASCKSSGRYQFQEFGRLASKEDLDRVLDHLQLESDPQACENLLLVFSSGTLSHLDDRVWELANHSSPGVRQAAETAMSCLSDPRLRELARQRVGDPVFSFKSAWELQRFDLNFEPGDETLIQAALERQSVDGEDAYKLCYYAVQLCTEARSPALAGVALWVYRTSPCTICRRHAVEMLLEWDCLPAHIAAECRYDASDELRALMQKAS